MAIVDATQAIWSFEADVDANAALANAVPYMQAFGHVVLAWTWLDVATCVQARADGSAPSEGRMRACDFFFHYELPKIGAWLAVARTRDATATDMPIEAF